MQRHKVRLGENEFFVRRYPPFQALEVLGDLQRRFGAPLLAAIDANPAGANADVLKVAAAGLSRISADMTGKDLVALVQGVLDPECVSVSIHGQDPVRLTPDALARSGMLPSEIVELCWEVVRHNFADFIERFAGRIGEVRSQLANPSDSFPPRSLPN